MRSPNRKMIRPCALMRYSCWDSPANSRATSRERFNTWTARSACSSPTRHARVVLGWGPIRAFHASPLSAFYLWQLGFPDQASARAQAAIALAARLDHPFTSAYAQFHVGLLHLWRQEPEIVLERAIRLLEIADEYDFQIWAVVGTCLLGAAQTALGRHEMGLAEIRRGMKQYQGLRTPPIFWPMLLQLEANACVLAKRAQEGLDAINAALEMTGYEGGAYLGPEFCLTKGDLLVELIAASTEESAEADRLYRLAFDRASAVGTRMPQLRAAIRLVPARRGGRGRGQLARDLRAVLDTFTEGFQTVDLLEARECLSALEG